MAGGGYMSTETTATKQKKYPLPRVASAKPPFTYCDVRNAIPPHCFKRSLIRSFSYLVKDLILTYIFYCIATGYFHLIPSPYSYLAWVAYWIAQGCVNTGIWIIGHECGHHGFSDYQWVDDVVGLILHSAQLTPYFSWRISHRRHHTNTGSLENDEVYIPRFKLTLKWYYKYLNNPVGRIFIMSFTLLFGWPLYLMFNVSGKSYDRFTSHYDPYSPLYNDRERLQIIISDAGIIATIYVLYHTVTTQGLAWVVRIYWVPLLIMNVFIVLVTILQHTHTSLPHYDSHVVHHLFACIPHYNAIEATEAIKPLLGDYYQFDGTPIFKAMWRDIRECIYVEKDEGSEDKGIYWYKNKI